MHSILDLPVISCEWIQLYELCTGNSFLKKKKKVSGIVLSKVDMSNLFLESWLFERDVFVFILRLGILG